MKRQETRQVQIKNLKMGGNDDVIIQSMCNIKTSKANQVIHQIHELETLGCQLIRVSCMDMDDANAIKTITENISIPLVADIHFDYKLALGAAERGIDKIRINPGNIGDDSRVKAVADIC